MSKAKKIAPTKITAKPKPKPAAVKSTAKAKAATSTVTSKTAPAKLTEVEKLKLQIKKLRASLKEATSENELQQKQIASLTRKNTNLSRKLDTTLAVTKPKTRAKAITLTLPETPKKPRSTAKPRSKQQSSDSNNEQWVDKWWDTF